MTPTFWVTVSVLLAMGFGGLIFVLYYNRPQKRDEHADHWGIG